jgi:hypothetical protein
VKAPRGERDVELEGQAEQEDHGGQTSQHGLVEASEEENTERSGLSVTF